MNYVFQNLLKLTTTKNLVVLFFIAHLILLSMMLFTFSIINQKIETEAFDLQTFGYSFHTAQEFISRLDDTTRNIYVFPQLFGLDVLYPFFLALFLSSWILRLVLKLKFDSFMFLIIFPFVTMGLDYIENIFVFLMITPKVDLTVNLVFVASFFTSAKSITTMVSWCIILILLLKVKLSK